MSNPTPYQAMQQAVDIVNDSEHISNKIAACLFKGERSVTRHNLRPSPLKNKFGPDIKIGQSSQFLHAEVACIFAADFATEGASLCVTDPFCPNCAKAICEAGIAHVYIDHKGLDKDFAKRRGDDFESLSLLMMEKAGIPVSILYRKDHKIEPLISPPVLTRAGSAQGMEFFDWDSSLSIADYLQKFRERQPHTAWAVAKIYEMDEKITGILAFEELTTGVTPQDYSEKNKSSEKYRLPVDPLNRLLFYCARKGFSIADNHAACNLYPGSRSLVNAVGFGLETIIVGENAPDHDPHGHEAGIILQKNGILNIIDL